MPTRAARSSRRSRTPTGETVTEQILAVGPAASQIAIKQLGTNGGGFFAVNSAHPFENPTPLSNFVEMFSLLMLPAALCYTFGKMIGDTRQGWALLAAMFVIFLPLLGLCVTQEQAGNPALDGLPIDQAASALQSGGNMEGKEVRFGIASSALWATATTAASNGSVNAMLDSFTPLGGLVPMWLMQLGEVVFGGAGSGLYGMLIFAIVAVFVAGLMVGRTPEILGKKIEAYEMKMASLVILVPPALVLVATAIACVTDAGQQGVANPSAHGFSEILYAFSSQGNNNGSAFAGIAAEHPVLRHPRRRLHVRRALLAHRAGARDRRLAREEEVRAEVARDAPHARSALRRDARRRGAHRRRVDLHPGPRARSHRRAPDGSRV